MKRRNKREIRALLRELPGMLAICAGLYAWALILWMVAP